MKPLPELLERLTKELGDAGKLIEAGWAAYRIVVLPDDCSAVQLDETRKAFFAGAHHLFASINAFLEEGTDATDNDLRRMDLIAEELKAYEASLRAEVEARDARKQ